MRIQGTLFAYFPPRPWCRTKTAARSRVCCVPPSWSPRPNQTTAGDMCTPDPSRLRRLRRAASSWQPAQHHSGTAAAGCPLPVSIQQTQPALLQPQETWLPAGWARFLMLYAAYDACLRKLRVCAAMHGCTHTVAQAQVMGGHHEAQGCNLRTKRRGSDFWCETKPVGGTDDVPSCLCCVPGDFP